MRRPRQPTRMYGLLGVTTILLIAILGYVAYRANSGLPGQSRYVVNVLVPDADRLINAADVRIGGVLVGEVLHVSAEPGAGGHPPSAKVKLALDGSVGHLPVDTTVRIRPASVLGLTYVDLTLGRSNRTVPANGTLPLTGARPASDLTDLFRVFNGGAARGFQSATREFAYGLAGRGPAINSTIGSLSQLVGPLTDVAGVLASPATRLSQFLTAYESTASALAPVNSALADLIANASTTFGAIGNVRGALGAAIDAAPGAESATAAAFTRARPALDGLARLTAALRPAGAELPASLNEINATLTAGLPALSALPSFAAPLRSALRSVDAFARDPYTGDALRKLSDLITPTNTVLSSFTPAEVDCNAISQWAINFSSNFLGLGDGLGPALPDLDVTGAGAFLEPLQNAKPSPNLAINPIPHENQSECEAGNEPYSGRQQLNNPPGLQSRSTRTTVPPPGVTDLARGAGLLKPIAGAQ